MRLKNLFKPQKKIMKYLVAVLLSTFICLTGFSQRNADIGILGGTSYYLGDLNPIVVFADPGYSLGPILRYNFNKRYSVKAHAVYMQLNGADRESNQFITKRNFPASFTANIINVGAEVEFNFFKFNSYNKPGMWSPYILGGVGYSVIISNNQVGAVMPANNHLSIPFGAGVKYNITRRLSGGLEWTHHKTFTSRLDGVVSPVGETFLANNDWYSYFGLFITYKFFKFAPDCPAYD